MSREIRIGPKADHFLQNIDNPVLDRIVKKIKSLADNPRPRNAKKVLGEENVFRTRVGGYRILYSVEPENVILIVNIDKRSRVYHR